MVNNNAESTHSLFIHKIPTIDGRIQLIEGWRPQNGHGALHGTGRKMDDATISRIGGPGHGPSGMDRGDEAASTMMNPEKKRKSR